MNETRLRYLDRAIEGSPDAAVNFVLRGEYWLEVGDWEQAAQDFEQALALANAALTTSEWGYLEQALVDRAEHGLRLITF